MIGVAVKEAQVTIWSVTRRRNPIKEFERPKITVKGTLFSAYALRNLQDAPCYKE